MVYFFLLLKFQNFVALKTIFFKRIFCQIYGLMVLYSILFFFFKTAKNVYFFIHIKGIVSGRAEKVL